MSMLHLGPMSRALGYGLPLTGTAAALAALLLWVSGIGLRWLDGLVLALLLAGLGLSGAGYLRGPDALARRVAVIGLGLSGLGVAMLVVLYVSG